MKKTSRRICAIFLACLLLCAIAPLTASAATEGDYTYDVSDGRAKITGYNGTETNVIIPSVLGGYPVTIIGYNAFFRNTKITSVVIPYGVTAISMQAFWGCTALTSVELPESLLFIGEWVFKGCTSLKGILLPESLLVIENGALAMCTALKEVIIPDSVVDLVAFTFDGCTSLERVVIGSGVVSNISATDMFRDCNNLAEIIVKEGNRRCYVKDGVLFVRNSGTVSLNPIHSVTLMLYPPAMPGDTYVIPNDITEVDGVAFRNCKYLADVYVHENVYLYSNTFSGSDLTLYGSWYSSARTYRNGKDSTDGKSINFVPLDGVPRIDVFTLSPGGTVKMRKNTSRQFTVRVEGFNLRNSTKEVTWQLVTGGEAKQKSTSLSNSGLLTIATGEPNQTLQVVAISKYDNSVQASTTIIVQPALIDSVLDWIRIIFLFGWVRMLF